MKTEFTFLTVKNNRTYISIHFIIPLQSTDTRSWSGDILVGTVGFPTSSNPED
jgi:hypothetical protein